MTPYKYPTPISASSDPVILGRHSLIWPSTGRCVRVLVVALHRRHNGGAVYAKTSDWITRAGHTIAHGHTRREALAALLEKARRVGPDAIFDGEVTTPLSVEGIVRWYNQASSEDQLRLAHLTGLASVWADGSDFLSRHHVAAQ
jgi:hypothetical protein